MAIGQYIYLIKREHHIGADIIWRLAEYKNFKTMKEQLGVCGGGIEYQDQFGQGWDYHYLFKWRYGH